MGHDISWRDVYFFTIPTIVGVRFWPYITLKPFFNH